MSDASPLLDVYLVGVPVALSREASEHFEELSREFMHLAHADESVRQDVPGRLLRLSDDLRQRFAAFTASADQTLEEAIASGAQSIDLHYRLPAEAGAASEELGRLLDEVDEYCAKGDYLLTMKTMPGPLHYRRWFLAQFIDQLAGGPPVAFDDWEPARSLDRP